MGLPCDTGTDVADTVRRLDGLILSGGADVDPTSYGEPRRHQAVKSNPARDAVELAVLEAAEALDLPTLAICRGIHVLDLACGGTLYQDLPTQRAEGLSHRQSGPPSALAHDVLIEPDSKLRAILGADSVPANSTHHQGVREVGRRVVARAPDGLVEGLEAPSRGFLLGVQWHPEELLDLPPHLNLLRALVAPARAYGCGGGSRAARARPDR